MNQSGGETQRGRGLRVGVRLEVWPELVHPAEAAGLAGARQEAFGSNGAPVPGPVHAHVLQQHRVLLRRPVPLPHRLAPARRRVPPAAAAASAPPPGAARCSSHCLHAKRSRRAGSRIQVSSCSRLLMGRGRGRASGARGAVRARPTAIRRTGLIPKGRRQRRWSGRTNAGG